MKKILYLSIIWVCCLVLMSSCHEDLIEETTITDTIEPEIFYKITLEGIVSDIEGNPIIDANVRFDGKEESTDSLGYFKLEDVEANSQGTYLETIANGFLNAGKRIDVLFSGTYQVTIVMNREPSTTSFTASEGTTLSISNIASVGLKSNGFLLRGESYSGNVNVRAMALAPDNPRLLDIMPGDLVGLTTENEITGLQSLGMLYVDLQSDQGEKISLAPGSPAEIVMQIPASMQSVAPNEIPLWHFDELSGYWVEEGMALRSGNEYVAEVSHFSWWNFDIPMGELGPVCLTIQDANSNSPLAFVNIGVSIDDFPFGFGVTNESGMLCEQLPIDQIIDLTIYNDCGFEQDVVQIGPFSETNNNEIVSIDYYQGDEIMVSGNFENCNGDPVEASYAVISSQYDRTPIQINNNGSFDLILSCGSVGQELTISALDRMTGRTGSESFTIQENVFDYNRTINLCGESTFFVYNNGGENLFYTDCIVVQNPNEIIIACNNNTCLFGIEGITVGQFNGAISCDLPVTDVNYTITELDEYISGSFEKNNINGEFRVKL